jgi:hypothetical protein
VVVEVALLAQEQAVLVLVLLTLVQLMEQVVSVKVLSLFQLLEQILEMVLTQHFKLRLRVKLAVQELLLFDIYRRRCNDVTLGRN